MKIRGIFYKPEKEDGWWIACAYTCCRRYITTLTTTKLHRYMLALLGIKTDVGRQIAENHRQGGLTDGYVDNVVKEVNNLIR